MVVTDILIALAVVGALGLLCGILLALFAKFFYVPEDETAKALRECLPGVNCGACGFKGCDDYAAAIAEGRAKTNLCVPGGDDTSAALAAIMGVEAEATEPLVAFVHCNGNCEATSKKAVYEGVQSCRGATGLYGGPNACIYGCLGFGDCAVVCPSNAICIRDGIAHIDPTLCIGCGLCSETCPKHIITMLQRDTKTVIMCQSRDKGAEARKLCSNACIACKKCEKSCPEGAISVVDNLARIDYEKCTRCGLCAEVCPTGCIKAVNLTK